MRSESLTDNIWSQSRTKKGKMENLKLQELYGGQSIVGTAKEQRMA